MRMRPERSAADSGIGSHGDAGTASSARPPRIALSGLMPVGTTNRSTLAVDHDRGAVDRQWSDAAGRHPEVAGDFVSRSELQIGARSTARSATSP
jgi:hypothetical protein